MNMNEENQENIGTAEGEHQQEASQPVFKNRIDLAPLNNALKGIKAEIGKIIVGQEKVVDLLLTAVLSEGHVLLEGVPGVAKTLMAKLLAKTISVDFSRIQFTPDLMPSDIIGTNIYNMSSSEFEFKHGPIFSNIVLIDEINRSPAKTQAALFEVMEERQITVDGVRYKMEKPFIVLATQNPVEQEGTYQLPEAQLDRFLFKINVDYPSLTEEHKILTNFHDRGNRVSIDEVQPVISAQELETYRDLVRQVRVEEKILEYIAKLVHNTRENRDLFLGASPRASLATLTGAKALAAISGRDFVTPEDVKYILPHALKHRIILTPEREMEGAAPETIIDEITKKIEVPR